MAGQFDFCGSQRLTTTDSAIGDSGLPIVLYGYTIESGATASKVIFRNGTSATATEVFNDTGTVNVSVVRNPAGGKGVLFPLGLFVDLDANIVSCALFYSQVRT